MKSMEFNEVDLHFMKSLAITEAQVKNQIAAFRKASCHVDLVRPCTVADGVGKIRSEDSGRYVELHQKAAEAGRFMKFVPASGAATRMFQTLFQFHNGSCPASREELINRAESGDAAAVRFLELVNGMRKLALYDDLEAVLRRDGFDVAEMLHQGRFLEIIEYMITEKGICCGYLPKGLLKFHRYPFGGRTAFEEHLVEAVHYIRDANTVCRMHFTISPEHEDRFRSLLEEIRPVYEEQYRARFAVDFSCQKRSTDTIAVDLHNRPFRDDTGKLVFRPGGHGALLENLNDLQGDLVYIKNIDNVVPDQLKESTCLWKKILGGFLVHIQNTIHGYVRRLKSEKSRDLLHEVSTFAREELHLCMSEGYSGWDSRRKRDYLLCKLRRPVRVCGVVRNVGEPGGAPFWIRGRDGELSLQIVEKAQVNFASSEQERIWISSTHFNPVDVVCAVRDEDGEAFDLKRYVDPDAVFISGKSLAGRELKALELPGLWNGAMSDWTTIFVEVPRVTFNPVKSINDLLRAEHQADDF